MCFQYFLFCRLEFYLETNPKFYVRTSLNVKANSVCIHMMISVLKYFEGMTKGKE